MSHREETSPLVTGVAGAVYRRIPSIADGIARMDRALGAGSAEVVA